MQVDLNIQNPAGGNSSDDDIHNRIKTGIADELLQFLSMPDKINLEKACRVAKLSQTVTQLQTEKLLR